MFLCYFCLQLGLSHFIYFSNGWSRCRDLARVGHLWVSCLFVPRCFQCKCSSLISIAFNDAPWGHWLRSYSSMLDHDFDGCIFLLQIRKLLFGQVVAWGVGALCTYRLYGFTKLSRSDYILVVGLSAVLSGGLFCIFSFLFPKSLFAYLKSLILPGHIKDTCMVLYLLPA